MHQLVLPFPSPHGHPIEQRTATMTAPRTEEDPPQLRPGQNRKLCDEPFIKNDLRLLNESVVKFGSRQRVEFGHPERLEVWPSFLHALNGSPPKGGPIVRTCTSWKFVDHPNSVHQVGGN
jgi:hypothetical protein